MKGFLAIGDCNTKGANRLEGESYPERVGKHFGCLVKNCGFTMSTTREGLALLEDNLTNDYDIVSIQFGLVDSYTTFRYAPYILYYPDNPLRKTFRNILKKYKKTCRKVGLNEILGECNVVSEGEYARNIKEMIRSCGERTVILPENIPHHDSTRNSRLWRYNTIIKNVAADFPNTHVIDLYADFAANMDDYYLDSTHMNETGYAIVSAKIIEKINEVS